MNRLFVCSMVFCTVSLCTLTRITCTEQQEISQDLEKKLEKISRENISQRVTDYLSDLCEQKGFSFGEIPEHLSPEAQTKIGQIMTELSNTMESNNRNFVYQEELETTSKKIVEFFLVRVHAFFLSKIGRELLDNLDTSPEARKSSKVVLPEDMRIKVKESKLFKRH